MNNALSHIFQMQRFLQRKGISRSFTMFSCQPALFWGDKRARLDHRWRVLPFPEEGQTEWPQTMSGVISFFLRRVRPGIRLHRMSTTCTNWVDKSTCTCCVEPHNEKVTITRHVVAGYFRETIGSHLVGSRNIRVDPPPDGRLLFLWNNLLQRALDHKYADVVGELVLNSSVFVGGTSIRPSIRRR